jgi:hypothetical protein
MMYKKVSLLIVVLVLAFLMPYLSRIPGTVVHGSDWFWSYLPDVSGFLFFSVFNLISIIPLLAAGLFFAFGRFKVSFALTALTHLIATFYFHHDYDLAADAQAAIGLIFIPIFVGVITLAVAIISTVVEWAVYKYRFAHPASVSLLA